MSAEPAVARGRWAPSWGVAGALCMLVTGVAIGLRPFTDNSFFTHLATGRVILDTASVPTADPYTFTAHGDPWVVQSWLASYLYATAEAVGGADGLRLLTGLVTSVLVLLAWRLSRPADGVVMRLAIVGLVVAVGAGQWAERPFMFGLVALALVALSAEGGLDPRWLVPVGWVWVNVHGSFPLAVVYLVALLVGCRLDGRAWTVELATLKWTALGIALGALSPVGWRLLVFPVELLGRQDVLENVIEWQAPTFDTFSQRAFVIQLVVAIVLLVRRPSYRSGVVIALFGAAALVGSRNLVVASLVFVPAMAAAAPTVGTLRSADRAGPAKVLAALGLAGVVLAAASRLGEPAFNLKAYPMDALAYLQSEQVDLQAHPMAAPDKIGNLLELTYGTGERVFYDDRFDMFPTEVSQAHLSLFRSDPEVRSVLDRYDIELVLWSRDGALAQRLLPDPAWRVLFTDERWTVLCRRGSDLGGAAGTC